VIDVTDSFEQALGNVTECAETLGHDHNGFIELEDFRGAYSRGYRFRSFTGATYLVHGDPESRFMLVTYPESAIHRIASDLTESDVARLLETPQAERKAETEQPAITAARAKLDGAESGVVAEIKDRVETTLKSGRTLHEFRVTDNDVFAGFNVHRRIFPYDEQFSTREFNDAVREVSHVGIRATEVLMDELDDQGLLDSDYEVEEIETTEAEPSRGFQ
jgi:hypothetical protein